MHDRDGAFWLKSGFERKLATYALAGGALLVAPSIAQAGVIYSGIQNKSTNPPYNLDLDQDGTADFSFGGNLWVTMPGGNAITGSSSMLSPVPAGGLIGKYTNWVAGYAWAYPSNTPFFLGLKFVAGDSFTHYGWVQIVPGLEGPTVLRDWAYESYASTDIRAGDTGGVPEPSSLALFALGAAGLAALRRKRARD